MTLEQIFSAAKNRAIVDNPLMGTPIVYTKMVLNPMLDGIAATSDDQLVIIVNPDMIQEFQVETQINIMRHEIMHAVEVFFTKD